jgi:hypothetical protein
MGGIRMKYSLMISAAMLVAIGYTQWSFAARPATWSHHPPIGSTTRRLSLASAHQALRDSHDLERGRLAFHYFGAHGQRAARL